MSRRSVPLAPLVFVISIASSLAAAVAPASSPRATVGSSRTSASDHTASGAEVSTLRWEPLRSAGRKDGAVKVVTRRAQTDPARQSQLAALGLAKRCGPAARVQSLHQQLGWTRPPSPDPRATPPPGWQRVVRPHLRERPPRWQYDVRLSQPALPSANPVIACEYQGLLYVVVERSDCEELDVYLSNDDGATWALSWILSPGANASNPSIAVTERECPRLLIAYEYARGTPYSAIHVYWEDLDSGDYGLWVVASGSSLSRPRICVDSPDYFHWYAYLTFIRGTITDGPDGGDRPERYDVRFSRSTTLGSSWEDPITLATDVAEEDFPDIDFGETNLYMTYTRTYAPGDRDTYVRRSTTWGSSWDDAIALGYSYDDEYDPCVAAANGGGGVIVAYTRRYASEETYLELYFSTNHGDTWNYSYLPPGPTRTAGRIDMAVNSGNGLVHAAFFDDQAVYYTSSEYGSIGSWSPLEQVSDWAGAVPGSRPAVGINPNRPIEECVVWLDQVYPSEHTVYFDAAYPIGQYLIILARADLRDEIQPLIDWKESLGYRVSVAMVPEILPLFSGVDDAEDIWLYLNLQRFETRYVLLVGEVDTIPMRVLYLDGDPGDGRGFGSDYYYSLLSDNSWDEDGDRRWGEPVDDNIWLIPDVMVGRVPLSDPADVAAFAQGVVAAEQDQGAWKRNVLFAHGIYNHTEEGSPRADDANAAERIISDWLTPNGWSAVRLYELGGIDSSYHVPDLPLAEPNFVIQRVPGRVGVVSAAAHGNWTGMTSYRWREDINGNGLADPKDPHREYDSNQFNLFANIFPGATAALVCLWGCETGVIFDRDPTFSQSGLRSLHLIRQASGDVSLREYLACGAPAAIGSSTGSDYQKMWLDPTQGGTEALNHYFFQYLVEEGLRAGDAFQFAQVRFVIEHTPPVRGIRCFNFFGDPSYEVTGASGRRWCGTGLPFEALGGDAHLLMANTRYADAPPASPPVGGPLPSDRDPVSERDNETTWWHEETIPGAMQIGTIIEAHDGSLYAGADLALEEVDHIGWTFRSFDDGTSWIPLGEMPFCWSVSALCETTSGALLAGGLALADGIWYGIIYRSPDGGAQWDIVAAFEDGMVFDVAQAPDGTVWACAGWDGWILRSPDDGISWEATAALGPDIHPYSILPASTGRLFIAMGGPGAWSALTYSDDGIIWNPPVIGANLSAAYDLMERDGLLFAGARADVGAAVCASDLNGQAWLLIYTLPDPRIHSVRSLCSGPAGYIFAGGDMERGPSESYVYARDPVTGSWGAFGGDLDLANYVRTLCATPTMLYAGTGELYGRLYRHLLPTGADVEDPPLPPTVSLVVQACPNPCRGAAEFRCNLNGPSPLVVRIHDAAGRVVRTLRADGLQQTNPGVVVWDGRDSAGRRLPAGVYTYQAIVGRPAGSGRLVLLR